MHNSVETDRKIGPSYFAMPVVVTDGEGREIAASDHQSWQRPSPAATPSS